MTGDLEAPDTGIGTKFPEEANQETFSKLKSTERMSKQIDIIVEGENDAFLSSFDDLESEPGNNQPKEEKPLRQVRLFVGKYVGDKTFPD